uniref:Uncharacterized protein n=1 Tax=Chlamydomonas leiostraca TaxID=1034604 RepID=A0A7S0S3W8_9CHLO
MTERMLRSILDLFSSEQGEERLLRAAVREACPPLVRRLLDTRGDLVVAALESAAAAAKEVWGRSDMDQSAEEDTQAEVAERAHKAVVEAADMCYAYCKDKELDDNGLGPKPCCKHRERLATAFKAMHAACRKAGKKRASGG